ncbi:unnamed protein product, partial [Adineta ricciae]
MADPNKNVAGSEINRFQDIFHGHDDDVDESDDANIDFDYYFMNFGRNEQQEQVPPLAPVVPEDETDVMVHSTVEEEHLSQRFSQLS